MRALLLGFVSTGLLLSACTDEESVDSVSSDLGNSELNNLPRHFPLNNVHAAAGGGGAGGNLVNHGGETITKAKVVAIYWGPSWGSGGSDAALASTLTSYIKAFGTSGYYNTITQYSGIQTNDLGGVSWVDSSTPPTNVTDSAIQSEVMKYINSQAGGVVDPSTIYEVFLPAASYSSDGSSTSCGGPKLSYCAYHGHISSNDAKYASMPYPSCSGCQTSGFNVAQNFEHFISHETREAVTDADGTAWYDRRGYEADDKCAWSPAPFVDSATGFAYQYEWSNATSSCIKSR